MRQDSWDVIVVGCGYAGAVAAIEAHDQGARVLLLEKMPDPGGISICSAGGIRITRNPEEAFSYLKATNGETAPDALLLELARGMAEISPYLERLAATSGGKLEIRDAPGNYPLPGHESFGFVTVSEVPGFDPERELPHVKGSPAGARLFKILEDNLRARAIELRCRAPVERLLVEEGAVWGVVTERASIRARGGVVLACGGFEGDPEMQKQFWQGKPVLSAAFRGNTGDGIRMAQARGAALWHMWHYHGSYGFRHPDERYPFGIRTKRLPDWLPGVGPPREVRMPWILLDRDGKRFMNEYEPYLQDTGCRPLERFRPETQDYPAIPAWLVADEEGRRLYPFARPTSHERGLRFDWSEDNLKEIEIGILKQATTIEALAAGLGLRADRLRETLRDWNRACDSRRDEAFSRPPTSLMPIRTPPFVYAPVWPLVSNTQGGPVHDERQRVIDVYGEPIPGLYAAGELGSVFGHLYVSGGNLAECFVGGRIAGREAAFRSRAGDS